jgi:23S rRNA-/tRNA-specific pseudouridylate synthase
MQLIPRLTPSCGSFDADKTRGPRSSSELDREKVMLHIDDNFVVINKPHDLRMDGDHELTVQKLLLEWIEGSSLSDLKWVHQLDYATSGTLAVARTRKMAGYASNSFEFRETHKEYLAIVEGHINYNQWARGSKGDEIDEVNGVDEEHFSTKAHGEKPPIPLEHEAARDNNVKLYYDALQLALGGAASVSSSEGVQNHVVDGELHELGQHSISDFLNPRNPKLRKRLRKAMRSTEYLAQLEGERGSRIITAPPSKKKKTSSIAETSSTVSVLHQVTADSPHNIKRVQVDGKDAIYISAAIAEVSGDFRMELGHAGNPGRPSQTTLYILAHKFYQGRPVTKVLLQPKSGRRHQLRLHTQAMGHPIVGDATYGTEHAGAAGRMMLHSYKLRIPVPMRKWKGDGPPPDLVDVTAQPFFGDGLDGD